MHNHDISTIACSQNGNQISDPLINHFRHLIKNIHCSKSSKIKLRDHWVICIKDKTIPIRDDDFRAHNYQLTLSLAFQHALIKMMTWKQITTVPDYCTNGNILSENYYNKETGHADINLRIPTWNFLARPKPNTNPFPPRNFVRCATLEIPRKTLLYFQLT